MSNTNTKSHAKEKTMHPRQRKPTRKPQERDMDAQLGQQRDYQQDFDKWWRDACASLDMVARKFKRNRKATPDRYRALL